MIECNGTYVRSCINENYDDNNCAIFEDDCPLLILHQLVD